MSTVTTDAPGPQDNPPAPEPDLPPGLEEGIGGLIRKNLFKDLKNSILTLIFGAIIAYALYRTVNFVFFNQKPTPEGGTRNAWDILRQNLEIFMVGTSFDDTGIGLPRLWASIYTIALIMGFAAGGRPDEAQTPIRAGSRIAMTFPPVLAAVALLSMTTTITPTLLTLGIAVPYLLGRQVGPLLPMAVQRRRGLIMFVLALVAFWLESGFRSSNIDQFGGLLLTLNVAFISIVACFPIGVVLALTRRSSFPLLRPLAVLYIELIRGVPLITLLFMGQFALRFFFPPDFEPPGEVFRAIIMFTLFSAAYVAEIVRGGLQSVPDGQTEAGQAVGLSPITISRKIVLPQALRNSIPALVGQFIALLKDTTLLIIIGLFELLGVSDPILGSLEFANQGYAAEVYAFVAFIFWVMCFSMSRASQRLETKLGVGTR
ncbi:amino acid ABC transporter permease [Euzebya tangerina]|uniref:amino acid ABC transporter permease n=1 Tax=Euzebya tangerina TaxID=591198 RepID=UPI000E315610|nr:amino acid ABC transporter permease [Euzebya tangerina]